MSRHRPLTPPAKPPASPTPPPDPVLAALKVATRAADAELARRRTYEMLLDFEERLHQLPPVPDQPPYRRPDGFEFSPDVRKS